MPRRPAPLPLSNDRAGFSFREAVDAGVTRRRLQHPDVVHPHHGRYAAAPAITLTERCTQAAALLGPRRIFSHVTAARVWGMPLPHDGDPDEPLHVMSLGGAEPLRRPAVVGWESAKGTARMLADGIPVPPPATVWAQLSVPGALGRDPVTGRRYALPSDWLVAIGDFLVTGARTADGDRGSRSPLATVAELERAVRDRRGQRGVRALVAALPLVRSGPESPRESLLRLVLIHHGLPEPEIQVPIRTTVGTLHADLGYPDRGVLIEYQGDHHRTDPQQWRADLRRRELFTDAGYRTIEATLDSFLDDGAALSRIVRRALSGS